MKKIILYIVVLFALSCQEKNETTASIVQYFDSDIFVSNEIEDILQNNYTINKEITLNQIVETKTAISVDSVFFNNEFKLLKSANINKPALLGFYTEDTISDEKTIISFYPNDVNDNKFKTKEMRITYKPLAQNEVEKVTTTLASKNFMHAYHKELTYIAKQSLALKSWEKTMFQDTLFYETKLTFIKN